MPNKRKHLAIDLFAGAGGLSLGFESKGFEIPLAIEKDTWAKDTYNLNHRSKNCLEADICNLPDEFFRKYQGTIDVVMGGPPCQGFSIAASNRRNKLDERNFLYRQFLRVISIILPRIVLIENVKEFVKYILPDGRLLIDDVTNTLDNLGYVVSYSVVDIRNYGIPQDRKRTFCLAVKKDLINENINILQLLQPYMEPETTLMDAIGDLPEVAPRSVKDGDVINYVIEPQNDYQRQMRRGSNEICNHIPMFHTPKTVEKFKYILANPTNTELPQELKSRVRGDIEKISESKFSQNHRVLDGTKVSPTITASFYSSFIHPTQPRNLTVREAARIQSFPDWFIFCGKKTTLSKKLLSKKGIIEDLHLDQFNQVGNAVPPKMAAHLASICKTLLEQAEK